MNLQALTDEVVDILPQELHHEYEKRDEERKCKRS